MLPPRETDPFSLLGVEPRPLLDEGALKEAYRRLSMRLHPDHAPPERREDALGWSSLLNRAHATLRDAKTRLPALLSMEAGGPDRPELSRSTGETGLNSGRSPMAPGAAVVDREMMELSLEVQRVCQAFDRFAAERKTPLAAASAALEGGWGEQKRTLEGLRAKLEERKERVAGELEGLDRRWGETPPPRTPLHRELGRLASWSSYLSKFEGLVAERILAIESMGL
jgi:curved DNA-binding protein CbpA